MLPLLRSFSRSKPNTLSLKSEAISDANASILFITAFFLVVLITGCDGGLRHYVRNGFKVGPNYCKPDAPVAEHWITEKDMHVDENPAILRDWWTVFKDPKLNELIAMARRQNLSLKEAGYKVLMARYSLAIARGDMFPQSQYASGDYSRNASSVSNLATSGGKFADSWSGGFTMQWELDFWGRFRRAITAAEASLDASVDNYDYVMVTMLGDIATNYITVRTSQEQIRLGIANANLQREVLDWIAKRKKAGYKQSQLDYEQSLGTLRSTEATVPRLQITEQQAENALCVLLGIPTVDLHKTLGDANIPATPAKAVVGIPADLLRRRPDVLQAERNAAAQAEQIGIAKTDLYPAFYINGSLGYTASNFPDLFKYKSFDGSIGPSFQWNILNYGRIKNNVLYQDAYFRQLVTTYQNTVLTANKEVENGIATYLRSQEQAKLLDESVQADSNAVKIAIAKYKIGASDFNTYVTIAQALVTQQDAAAQAHGNIASGLIAVYRALGGGWELKNEPESQSDLATIEAASAAGDASAEQSPTPSTMEDPAYANPPAPKKPAASKEPALLDEPTTTEPIPPKKAKSDEKAAAPKATESGSTDAVNKDASDASKTEKAKDAQKPTENSDKPAAKAGQSSLRFNTPADESVAAI